MNFKIKYGMLLADVESAVNIFNREPDIDILIHTLDRILKTYNHTIV